MFGWLKKKNKATTTNTIPATTIEVKTINGVFSSIDTGTDLLKQATAFYKEGKLDEAIACIDKKIALLGDNNVNVWSAYKKKCSYLYKSGRGDEAWAIYGELSLKFHNDYITVWQIADEQRKQLEFEKKYIEALNHAIMARVFSDRSGLIQNHIYKDNTFKIDYNWEQDGQFIKLAKKANMDWTPIKAFLVFCYKNINHESNFQHIWLEARNGLKLQLEQLKK